MDLKAINDRKERLHKRIITDTILGITGTVLIVFFALIIRNLAISQQVVMPIEELTTCSLLIITTFLLILSGIFSLRRYIEVREALKEFNSIELIKEEILSNLRHELKTPLIPIKGYSELLYDETLGEINPRQKDVLKKIITSSEKLERRIDSLIFISAAKHGDIEYTFTTMRIEDIINSAVAELSNALEQKKQKLEINIQSKIPFIEGDKQFLKEAILQILENAIKFSPSGKNIQIIAHEGYKSIHIKVIDQGIGIPDEEIENIFLRFYQVDGSKTRRYGGNGLGLHIAKTIIEAHRGNIWIESIPEKKTTVHIKIPT